MALQKQNSQRYICLADDDPDDRELFFDALREVDPSVILTQAEDGIQLMKILSTISDPLPEVLFLDISMPGISGLECLKEIRRAESRVKEINTLYSPPAATLTILKRPWSSALISTL